MRGFLFKSTGQVFAFLIASVQWTSNLLLKILGNIGYALMTVIDKKRLDLYEQIYQPEEVDEPNELAIQSLELRLLASANQVRDHALETDDWTNKHTDAINAIAESLVFELGWTEEDVNRYMKEVVESIDGLQFGTEG